MDPRIRIVIAEDHPDIAGAVTRLLPPRFEVVAQVADGVAAVDAAKRLTPEVMILDLQLPQLSGLDACRRIASEAPATKLIIMTADVWPELTKQSESLGICAVVSKLEMHEALVAAIDAALRPSDGAIIGP